MESLFNKDISKKTNKCQIKDKEINSKPTKKENYMLINNKTLMNNNLIINLMTILLRINYNKIYF